VAKEAMGEAEKSIKALGHKVRCQNVLTAAAQGASFCSSPLGHSGQPSLEGGGLQETCYAHAILHGHCYWSWLQCRQVATA
jgi:hypothetical protein